MTSQARFFANGYCYHCFNRGVDKRDIFLKDRDYLRFLEAIETANDPSSIRTTDKRKKIGDRYVEIINYCLMPNHYHLTLRQVSNNGITIFLHRLGTAWTKYFNTKYGRSGRLFEYVYKTVDIQTDEQLIHLSRYIRLNPFVAGFVKTPEEYRWSSLKNYYNQGRQIDCNKETVLQKISGRSKRLC